MLVTLPCGVCGSTTFIPLYASTIPAGADPRRYFSSSRELAGHLAIVQCRQCGLVMTNPRDDDETLHRVYASLEDATYDGEDDNRQWSADAHLQVVESYQRPPGRLLDVGCATGLFVGAATASGWDATGLEASAWAVERARQRVPRARFERGLLETVQFPTGAFDVVTLWDVLEHVSSPIQTLQRVRGWIRPGGYLFLSLPNVASMTARLMGGRWVLLLREHLWYFSPRTIGLLFERAGFRLVKTRRKPVRFSIANILGRLGQYPGTLGALCGNLSRAEVLRRLPVRFAMGEMDVVAQPRTDNGGRS